MTSLIPTPAAIELEVARIRELSKSSRYRAALEAAEWLATRAPAHRDVLYLVAVNQRCLQLIPQALATLEQLERHHPQYGLLYQERGFCYLTRRDSAGAAEAFSRALALDPTLSQSWTLLERLYRMSRDTMGLRQLAQMARELGNHRDAQRLLAEDPGARVDYVRVLIDRQSYAEAGHEIESLLKENPLDGDLLFLRATACSGLAEHEQAIEIYRRLLATAPERAELHLSLAHALKALGRRHEAIESYRAAARVRPSFGDAYWSLANLKTYTFSEQEIELMRAREAEPTLQLVDRYHFCFALGKALEDRAQYAQSWSYYERGNALKRAQSPYHPPRIETFTTRADWGAPDAAPIFIVGLPRSGSTLIEQILASHSRVQGTQELPNIQRIAAEAGEPTKLEPQDFRALGRRYLDETRVYRRGSERPYFVDKMPNNWRHIGLIAAMLPNAKIIDVRREPIACCFGNLKQLFAAGHEFSYDMRSVAHYYRTYLDLMRHWDAELPGRVLRVHYEDVVEDLQSNVERILRFCGLRLEPSCLEFHKTARSVATASSEQVRQPLSRAGLSQWRHYEPWLGPLREALGDALERYRE